MGRPINDDHFLLLFNADWEPIHFTLPPKAFGSNWRIRLDTTTGAVDPADAKPWRARSGTPIDGHSHGGAVDHGGARRPNGPPRTSGRSGRRRPWPRSRPRRAEPRCA